MVGSSLSIVCTVLFAWQWRPEVHWLVAANRDELRSRPSEPPTLLQTAPPIWGGRDQLAGGTWLAVDPAGRLCAVTNRHPGGHLPERDPRRRSRGDLPTRVLGATSSAHVRDVLAELRPEQYNPVNVLFLSPDQALWVGLDDQAGRLEASLTPGVHVLTEQDPDDPGSEKTARLLGLARDAADLAVDADDLLDRFRQILCSHDRGAEESPQGAACIHEATFGTVSSATVAATADAVSFHHAEGQPCVTPYVPVFGPSRLGPTTLPR